MDKTNRNDSLLELKQVYNEAECLIGRDDLIRSIAHLSHQLAEDIGQDNPIIMCVMNGGLLFFAHLLTYLDFPLQIDYVHVSRYRDALQGGDMTWKVKPNLTIEGRGILLVDDILDEGVTMKNLIAYCQEQGAAWVKSAVLLNKLHDRKQLAVQADYVVQNIDDRYVFGFGLDYKGYWRNAPGIFALKKKTD